MKKKLSSSKKKCDTVIESSLECKATAAVTSQVEADVKEEDKPIEEIINNAQDTEQ